MTERFDVATLLGVLSIEEKAALCSGSGFWHTRAIERVGIPSMMVTDGPHGLRKQASEQTDHVGIGGSEPATCFPTASTLGSTWDVALLAEVGEALGREARAADVGVVLGPGVNLKRSPLCGRNFEYLSEDPVLAGDLAAAMVQGIQRHGVGTSLKHFAVNNQETDRLRVSADVDDRALRELYLHVFERVVRAAQPWTVMCSYNRINGVYASQDPWLLTQVLRDEWGFDGLVVSDWGAVDDPVASVAAGLDLEMPSTGGTSAARLVEAVRGGTLDEAALDGAVGRLLRLLERALPGVEAVDDVDLDAHHDLARAAAAAGTVLLKNIDAALPLRLDAGMRVAVIGEFARTPRYQGAGSSKVNPTRVDDALGALRAGVPAGVVVDFAAGFTVAQQAVAEDDGARRTEAVRAAAAADVVVLFLGLPAQDESEGYDREHLDLPANQIDLLRALASVHRRLVVVLANGGVVTTSSWDHHAAALLECWLGGQAGGAAVADVLLGAVNPSGRLAETIPRCLEDNPSFLNFPGEDRHVRYGEGLFVGYRHYDAVGRAVSYPFGHGLSYTTFAYSDLDVTVLGDARGDDDEVLEIACRITNTGARSGAEVVQVYVGDPVCAVARPVRELRAFTKVTLAPDESARVSFRLRTRDLSYWSTRAEDWVFEPGTFEVTVGASSRDLRLCATVEVAGPPLALPLDRTSTLGDWLAHPVGDPLLREAFRTNPGGDLTPLLADPEGLRMLSSFPMTRLVGFFGSAFTLADLDALLAQT